MLSKRRRFRIFSNTVPASKALDRVIPKVWYEAHSEGKKGKKKVNNCVFTHRCSLNDGTYVAQK